MPNFSLISRDLNRGTSWKADVQFADQAEADAYAAKLVKAAARQDRRIAVEAVIEAERVVIDTCYSGEGDLRHTWSVVAETARGERFVHRHLFTSEAAARALARKVGAAGSIDPNLWGETYPIYGSLAWADEDAEAMPYRLGVRAGFIREEDVPEAYQAIL